MMSRGFGLELVEKAIQDLGTRVGESWQIDHGQAILCRDFEVTFKSSLVMLNEIGHRLAHLGDEMTGGIQFGLDQLVEIRETCRLFLVFRDQALGMLVELERAEFEVEAAEELVARLRKITEVVEPLRSLIAGALFRMAPNVAVVVSETASSPGVETDTFGAIDLPLPGPGVRVKPREGGLLLPDPPIVNAQQSAPFDLPLLGPRTRVKAREGSVRLPDPPSPSIEHPAPFDLPRPGVWVRVKARPGLVRLPDPIDD